MGKNSLKLCLQHCAGAAALVYLTQPQANDIPKTPPTPSVPMAETKDPSTFVAKGHSPKVTADGMAEFTLDARPFSFGDWLKLVRLPNLAIVFDGDKDKNRLCPVFNLAGRDYVIEEVENLVYKITLKTKTHETDSVRAAKCALVTGHSLHKVKPLNFEHR